VLGDTGILLDPDDVPGWTAAIVKVVNDQGLRSRMAESGRARAAAFTWSRTARTTMEVYRSVVDRRR
jgi:alpha-1,3-rhamnosyl/mannosyltransferase